MDQAERVTRGQRPFVMAMGGLFLLASGAACGASVLRPSGEGTGTGGAGPGAGPGLGELPPPSTDGGPPMCGPRIEGPPVPCPDAAPPMRPPAPRDAAPAPPPAPDATPPVPPPPAANCPAEGPVTVKVRAWGATPTCVYLRAGETAEITGSGRWRAMGATEVGPEGRTPNHEGCPRGALVARVAKFHQRTCIGASGRITAKREGFLWLYQSGGWNAMDSTGEIDATITGGGRNPGKWPEGLTPTSLDPRVEQARVQSFEPLCGRSKLQVFFGAQDPNHPRVVAYVRDYFGGDPVGWISRALVRGCATFFETPADFIKAWGNNRRGRLVHWVGDNEFPGPRTNGDFNLRKTVAEITSMQPDYGPFGGPPVSIMHEAGHWISPEGGNGMLPKWLNETYAELLPTHIGDDRTGFHNSIDNPESVRFGATFWWCDGTFGGATFINWINTQHPGFLHALTRASISIGRGNPWPGSNTVFQQITGKPFDELWKGYADAYDFAEYKPDRPIEKCMDPQE
jgi:hypothetical protein